MPADTPAPTNAQLYELFKSLDSRVEDMDADHSAQLRKLKNRLPAEPESPAP